MAICGIHVSFLGIILPETNISPENGGPLEEEIPNLETIIFRGYIC